MYALVFLLALIALSTVAGKSFNTTYAQTKKLYQRVLRDMYWIIAVLLTVLWFWLAWLLFFTD
jgi:hypothetical protein